MIGGWLWISYTHTYVSVLETGIGSCEGLTMSASSGLNVALTSAAAMGRLTVEGSVDIDSPELYPNYIDKQPAGTEFLIIDNDGSDPINGTFADLPEGGIVYSHGIVAPFRISYVGGDGNDVTLRVYDNSTTFISVSPAPSQVGQSVTITAAVNASGVTGNVDFYSDDTLLGTVPLAGAQAVLATTAIPAGTHVITAKYLGNSQFIESEGSVSHTVLTGPAPVATSTNVTVTPTPSVIGQMVTIIAAVTPVMPMSGQVAFRVDGNLVGTSSVVNGFATFTTNAIPFGAHTITAEYAGDEGSLPSNGSVSHSVNNVPPVAATTTVLTINPEVIVPNAPLLLVATVISNDGVPQGTVTIFDGNDVYAIVPLDAFGKASATIVFRDGPHTLRAVYSGSASHASSSSIDVTVPLGRGKRRAVR